MSNFSTLKVCAWPTRGAARLAAKKRAIAISKCLVIRHLLGGLNSVRKTLTEKLHPKDGNNTEFPIPTLTIASYASRALEATISPPEAAPLAQQVFGGQLPI